jgi:hypothetical protein
MAIELDDVFADLDPPAGGHAALMAKIEGRRFRLRLSIAAASLAAAACVVVAVIVALGSPANPSFPLGDNPALIRWRLAAPMQDGVEVRSADRASVALLRLPDPAPDVILYEVAVTDPL